jgi:chromosome segregation ATPase
MEINKLINENKNLSDIVNDQDKKLKKAQEDVALLNNKCNENEMDIQNLNGKNRDLINNINSVQKALDGTNLENRDLNDKIRDYERQCDNLKNDNNIINNTILKERALRCEKERQNKNLNDEINDRDIHINDLSNQLDTVVSLHTQATNDSKNYQLKNDNLKQHIMLLTQQNQKLLNELEVMKEQDFQIKSLLEKKGQSYALLRGVQGCLEQANICLQKVENDPLNYRCNSRGNSPTHYNSNSPRLTYDRKN